MGGRFVDRSPGRLSAGGQSSPLRLAALGSYLARLSLVGLATFAVGLSLLDWQPPEEAATARSLADQHLEASAGPAFAISSVEVPAASEALGSVTSSRSYDSTSAFSDLGSIVHGSSISPYDVQDLAVLSHEEIADQRSGVASTTRCPTGWIQIGRSVRGRPIVACKLGSGRVNLAVMGGIHGGWELNSKVLVERFLNYYARNRWAIPAGLVVYFVPTTNPDGVAHGTSSSSAWNARGVDLNRNFDSGNWSRNTYGSPGGRYGPTGTRRGGGGTAPFSEPETRSIRDFVRGQRIGVVLSYHGGIKSVSAKDGGGGVGEPLARLVARSTGYSYIAKWTSYRLTGQFMDWLDRVRVKGVEIDLPDRFKLDYWNNIRALGAVMATLVGR